MGSGQAFLYTFDILELDGQDLRSRPWQVRRETLTRLLGKRIRASDYPSISKGENGAAVFRAVCSMGLEGIVAKRRDRPYWSGRCADWGKGPEPQGPGGNA